MCESKYKKLLKILQEYEKIGVAFSGGVDSTLLLYGAVEALGTENVVALYILSQLNSSDCIESTRAVFNKNFPRDLKLREIELFPLTWPEFVINSEKRCYFCKKRMYTSLKAALPAVGCYMLADGTNVDDLREDRPGLAAIRELDVLTPLVDARLTKKEIRKLAEMKGISNYGLPSNSCLATRVQKNNPIDLKSLDLIENAENFLYGLGFHGCRVRLQGSLALIEVQTKNLETFVEFNNREQVKDYFKKMGLAKVVLNIEGR